ncbi:MAG: SGNH/GDSL hydrolase family protein [Deltaproteobacteria bacterium]|nr:SGNH/GDSL hydrolase family protein [Deltaproteobacteria bacterium]
MEPLGGSESFLDRIGRLGDHLPRWPAWLAAGIAILLLIGWATEAWQRRCEGQAWTLVTDPKGMKYAFAYDPEQPWERGWQENRPAMPLQPEQKRVICVGDDVTYGEGVPAEATWPARLEAMLGPDRVEVLNVAVPGWDAEQAAALVASRLQDWAPDLVIWGACPNDRIPTWTLRDAEGRRPIFVGSTVPPEVALLPWGSEGLLLHSASYRRLQGAALARAERRRRLPDPPESWFTTQVHRFYAWSRHSNVPVLVLTIPPHVVKADGSCETGRVDSQRCVSDMRAYQKNGQEIDAVGLPRVDGVEAFAAGAGPFGLEGTQDPLHPNAAGHEALALAVTPRAADLLEIEWPLVDPARARTARRKTPLPGTSVRLPARQAQRPAEAVTLPGRRPRSDETTRLPSGPGPQQEAP